MVAVSTIYLSKVIFCIAIWNSVSATFLSTKQISPAESSKPKPVFTCEHNELNLSCEEGEVIHIIQANYGRLTRNVCNDNGQVVWSGEDCKAYSSLSIVKDRCEKKQKCRIQASNSVFGDPCHGTIKYLEVQHECVPLDTHFFQPSYTCENNTLHMGCEEGRVIHIIRANYGRLDSDICNHYTSLEWHEHCISNKSHLIMVDRCELKQNCTVMASNEVFGDTCKGTAKYLEVQHVCISPSNFATTIAKSNTSSASNSKYIHETTPEVNPKFKTARSCENDMLHVSCEDGQVIHIIHANYGRLTLGMCRDICELTWNGHCTSNSSYQIMVDRCEEKQSCSVPASNSVFGDPCHGIFKYLEVQYICRHSLNIGSTIEKKDSPYTSSHHDLAPDSKLADNRLFRPIYACEGSKLYIDCGEDRVIHILRANYGRLTIELCNKDAREDWRGYCIDNSSYTEMTNRCEQRQNCSVEVSNSIFGDPCPGTLKYLEVQHVCVSPSYLTRTAKKSPIDGIPFSSDIEIVPASTIANSHHFKTVISCENDFLHMNCEKGQVIHVVQSNYGRLAAGICKDSCELQWNGHCISNTSSYIINDRCEHMQNCSVKASNRIFGDPCYGTRKYLEVQYICVSASNVASTTIEPTTFSSTSTPGHSLVPATLSDSGLHKTLHSCENNELHVDCGASSVIHIIQANYGRLTRDLCNPNGKVPWSGQRCTSERSESMVAVRCEHKQSCSVKASNIIFGDPCYGTRKYLEIQYTCVPASNVRSTTIKPTTLSSTSTPGHSSVPVTSSASNVRSTTIKPTTLSSTSTPGHSSVPVTSSDSPFSKTLHSCENSELHIGCVEGSVIHIIRANYGRSSRNLCNEDGQVVWSGRNCTSERSYPVMSERCEQKCTCSVPACSSIFGDPCHGTVKYLEVQYICVSPKQTSAATTAISITPTSSTPHKPNSTPVTTLGIAFGCLSNYSATTPVPLSSTSSTSTTKPTAPGKTVHNSTVTSTSPSPDLVLKRSFNLTIQYSEEVQKSKSVKREAADNSFVPKWKKINRLPSSNDSEFENVETTINSPSPQNFDLSYDESKKLAIHLNAEKSHVFEVEDMMKENEIEDDKIVLLPDLESSPHHASSQKKWKGNANHLNKETEKRTSKTRDEVIRQGKKYLQYLKSTEAQDADEAYGHFIAESLNLISDPKEREIARIELQKVLLKYRF